MSNIHCQVIVSHGPLQNNPNTSLKCRVRQKFIGKVIGASRTHTWGIMFDFNRETKRCKSGSLKIVPNETGIPIADASSQFSPHVENGDTMTGVVEESRSNVASESIEYIIPTYFYRYI